MSASPVDDLVAAVQSSAKYRHVAPDLIRRIGARELAQGQRLKEAIKATKDKLHQVGGAFLDPDMAYAKWLQELRQAQDVSPEALRAASLQVMRHHASTRERLPFLAEFYAAAFAELSPVTSVLDLACGLHPLGIPWMPLAPGATYHAVDIFQGMMDLLSGFFPLVGVSGDAHVADLTQTLPAAPVDIAFLLKTLPTLEQIDPAAPRRLLDSLAARRIIVSYPARSLGGKAKGMPTHYAARFRELVADKPWRVTERHFPTELVFIVDT